MVRPMRMKPARRHWRLLAALGMGVAGALSALPVVALADQPRPWQMGMQPAASPVQARIEDLHTLVLVIITVITLFVAGLLLFVVFRFNERRNPRPGRTSHNTVVEVAWTVIPVLILVTI